MSGHYPLIRTIYLYLFTLVGLVLLTIGGVRFVNMGLKAFLFTQAEEEQKLYSVRPPEPYFGGSDTGKERAERLAETASVTEDERAAVRRWLADYAVWEERQKDFDPVVAGRHRDAAMNLAFLVIGLPLYLYHWSVIRRETKG